jgi:parallel beta-helix repeat protein
MVATIYILSDGTINPSSAPIIRSGETFTLTDNIGDSIYIQREGITLDGAGFTVDGPGSGNGIYMDHMTSVTIKNLNIIDFTYGIYLSYSSYSTIDSITVTGNSHLGIYLFRSGYSTVTNNDVTGINYGIFLIRSGSSTLTNNIVAGNRNIGIRLSYSSSSTLTDNTVTGNGDAGIDLRNSGYSTLTGNTVTGLNPGFCIRLANSGYNILRNNDFASEGFNFIVEESYVQDIDDSNTVKGKPMYYWVGVSYETVPSDAGFVGIINSHHITVEDLILSDNQRGVLFAYTTDSTIRNVQVTDCHYGIYMHYSSSNTLTGNIVTGSNIWHYGIYLDHSNYNALNGNTANNYYYSGIHLIDSNYNTFTGNTVDDNNDGIRLSNSRYNTFTGNIATGNYGGLYISSSNSNTVAGNTVSGNNNGIYLYSSGLNTLTGNTIDNNGDGIYLRHSSSNTVVDNTATGNSNGILLYQSSYTTVSGTIATNNGVGIILYQSSYNTVSENTPTSNNHGISLHYSYDNTVADNTATANGNGIYGKSSSSNIFTGNSLADNEYGFYLYYFNDNAIYYNNFIDNINQVENYMSTNTWESGAEEGNYWTDYIGLDDGSDSREAGDSIGDTNYPHLGVDSFPLMYPYSSTPVGVGVEVIAGEGVTLDFSEVTTSGNTVAEEVSGVPPANHRLIPAHTYYSITSSVTFVGTITISINYDPTGLTLHQETMLKLKNRDETTGAWTDITTWVDTVNNIIYGDTTHLSIFAVMLNLNEPPIPNSNGPYISPEGKMITFDASGSSDPNGDILQYRWDFDDDGIWDTEWSYSPFAEYMWSDEYFGYVTVQVTDGEFTDSDTTTITVDNEAPTALLFFGLGVAENYILTTNWNTESYYIGIDEYGTLTQPELIDSQDQGTCGVGVGDFDNDGDLDALVGDRYNTWYYEKIGSGNDFAPAVSIHSAYVTHRKAFAVAYYNEDVNLDAVLSYKYQGRDLITIYLGNGDGTFTSPRTFRRSSTYGLDSGDFNTDGNMDFIIASGWGPYIYFGKGDGSFQSPIRLLIGSSKDVCAGDFDNDGDDDLIYGYSAKFYPGNGDGTFGTPTSLGFTAYSMADSDINMDGNLDFVYNDGSQLHYITGNGDGTFSLVSSTDLPFYPGGIASYNLVPQVVDEGDMVWFTGTFIDPGYLDTHTASWDWGDGSTIESGIVTEENEYPDATGVVEGSHLYGDNGVYTIELVITDDDNGGGSDSTLLTVVNIAPSVSITSPDSGGLFTVDAPVPFTGSFTDPGIDDTHTAIWTLKYRDLVITFAGVIQQIDGSWSVSGTHMFDTPGIYYITLTVTDDDGGEGIANKINGLSAFIVVYDPDGGFVTGGGWFESPYEAYDLDPYLTGKASFGFVSKYQTGASTPTGETEFHFNAANLYFHSTSYDWLVIGGARAQYKGSGTLIIKDKWGGPWATEIECKFMLTAIDGQKNGGGGKDKIRLKIWQEGMDWSPIYDNNERWDPDSADPTTEIGAGNIVIHKG